MGFFGTSGFSLWPKVHKVFDFWTISNQAFTTTTNGQDVLNIKYTLDWDTVTSAQALLLGQKKIDYSTKTGSGSRKTGQGEGRRREGQYT